MKILIVGSGLFGSVCAYEFTRAGHLCQVLEKRSHIGGNIYTKYNEEAQCHEHVYGAHIFHTSSKKIWDYINRFAEFNRFVNRVKVNNHNKIYSFPVNLLTLYQVYGVTTPQAAKAKLASEIISNGKPKNMEEYCLSVIGKTLYELFIEGYTQKQWNKHPRELPAEIIKRIPVRFNFDDNYFNDTYQGIPIGGYTAIIEKLLDDVPVQLSVDFLEEKEAWEAKFDYVVYTGSIDAYFDCCHGQLEYRSLRFERELLPINDFQGNAVVNYTDQNTAFTRIIEHKHFNFGNLAENTLITKEYPTNWKRGEIEYYPMNDELNNSLFKKYREKSHEIKHRIHFGGRLGEYKYYDMHQVIGSALVFVDEFKSKYFQAKPT